MYVCFFYIYRGWHFLENLETWISGVIQRWSGRKRKVWKKLCESFGFFLSGQVSNYLSNYSHDYVTCLGRITVYKHSHWRAFRLFPIFQCRKNAHESQGIFTTWEVATMIHIHPYHLLSVSLIVRTTCAESLRMNID